MTRRLFPILCLTVSLCSFLTSPGIAKKNSLEKKPAGNQFQVSKQKSNTPLARDLGKRISVSAVLDTFVLAEFSFNCDGLPSTEGWIGVDMTAQMDTFCHIADATELNGGTFGRLVVLDGNQSLWCGAAPQTSGELCKYSKLPGYGEAWRQYFVSIPFDHQGDVTLSYLLRCDMEWGEDWLMVQVWRKPTYCPEGCWEELAFYSDTYDSTITEDFTIADSLLGDTVQFRFAFSSDGGWSDEDGLWDTDGAFIIDNITISDTTGILDFQDFESETVGTVRTNDGHWTGDVSAPFGDFSGLFSGLSVLQEDPCAYNSGTFWGFFNGSTDDYSCGGHPEQTALPRANYDPDIWDISYCGATHLANEIWSPPINWTTDINGTPVPATAASAQLEFDVYRDLPAEYYVFYNWDVRNIFNGCPSFWASEWNTPDQFQAYHPRLWGGGKVWYRERFEFGDLISPDADAIQIALGAYDLCGPCWPPCDGSECHSHAPLFDNVRVVRINTNGPIWRERPGKIYKTSPIGYSLFQDNFAGDGTITGTVRIDVPKYDWTAWCGSHQNPSYLPGDSATVTVSHPNGIAYHVPGDSSSGPAVYCHVKDVLPGKSGAAISGDLSRWPVVAGGGGWTLLRCDSSVELICYTPPWITDEYCVDLNDNLYTPGDTIYYYFSARDANGNTNYWSEITGTTISEAEARANPNEVTCLPANALSGATDILYIDDFDEGGVQPFFESAFEMLGLEPDRYDVRRSTALLGNGPGRRVADVVQQLAGVYRTIIWNSGDLREGLIGDGTGNPELSDDFEMLFTFLDQSPNRPGLYISGNNIASEWDTLIGPGALNLRGTYMNFDLASADHSSLDQPLTPLVIGESGSCFDHISGPDLMLAYGGCSPIADFDVLQPSGGSTLAMTYSGIPAYGAVLTQVTPNTAGDTARVVLSGFSYHVIRDDVRQSIPDRVVHLLDILRWLENGVADPTSVTDSAVQLNSLTQNYPNPFNPSTTIHYSIKEKGHVTLKIYNVAGEQVRTLVDELQIPRAAGFTITWDGKNAHSDAVASGVYFYKLTAKNFVKTKKMIVLK